MALLKQLLAVALLGATAFFVSLYPVSDADIFWHLAAGRDMVASGSLPQVDNYSVSSLGRTWANGHVLFELAVVGLHRLGGLGAIVLAKALTFALAAALLGSILVRRKTVWLAVVWAMGLICLSRPLLLERPVALSLLFVVAHVVCLERFRDSAKWLAVAALPVICGLWTWCQPLWPLGPALVLAYLLDGGFARDKRAVAILGIVFGVSCLACLAGPYGLRGLALPFIHLRRIGEVDASVFSANVSENLPLWRLLRSGDPTLAWLPLVAGVTLALLVVWPRGRIRWARLSVVAAFLGLTLIANRNALLFYWAAALIGGLQLAELEEDTTHRVPGGPVLLIGTCFAIAVWLMPAWPTWAQLKRPRPFLVPETTVSLLDRLPQGAKVFASVRYGSFLVLATAPRVRPYLDGRLVLRSAEEFSEYLRAVDVPSVFPLLDEKHHFDAVLLPVAGPERYQGLIASLATSPSWGLADTDGLAVLFLRRDRIVSTMDLASLNTAAQLRQSLEKRFEKPDERQEALTRLGWLLSLLGHENRAAQVLGQVNTPKARALLAASHYRAGDRSAAKRVAMRLLETDENDVNALVLLTTIALDEGEIEKAEVLVRTAAQVAPHDPRVEAAAGQVAGAMRRSSP